MAQPPRRGADSGLSGFSMGEALFGLQPSGPRPPNTASPFRYIFVLLVIVVGAIYAAPNLYQPDPAVQIRAQSAASATPDSRVAEQAVKVLEDAGVPVKRIETLADSLLISLSDDAQQLRARDLLDSRLNPRATRDFVVALSQAPTTPQWLRDIGGKPMSLGLDLSGGVHFLLQVDLDAFIGNRLTAAAESIRDQMVSERVRYVPGSPEDWVRDQAIFVPFPDASYRDQGRAVIEEALEGFEVAEVDVGGVAALRLKYTEAYILELEDFAISQNLTSLRNRVNETGVAEPQVQRFGRSRIVLDLPGVKNPADVKRIINKFANLEFRLVALPNDRPSETERYEYERAPVVLQRRNIVTGNDVINAQQDYDPETGMPQVSITLDSDGGERMHDVTRNHVNDDMAILFIEQETRERKVMVDGVETIERTTVPKKRVINVANINSPLSFRFRITGLEFQEARDLALLLRAGALAAPMYIVEERTVGPSLGKENIEKGRMSVIIGMLAVVAFMFVYYKFFGLAANIALAANVVLIVAIMSLLGATLTLPGIAGIVLTIGMAVDANVLIFSRIKEELKERSPQAAIQAGFDRAFITIMDANITTFFVAIILLSIGSGPVKGFAVTLAVGIVTSMFTAIMGTRALINLMFGGRELKKVWI